MKICIFTLGCKVNQYESDAIATMLKNEGHEVVQDLCVADLYILNTCAITNEAEKKSRQMFAKFKKLNPDAKVIVCGCSSQNNPDNFRKFKNAGLIIGTYDKSKIQECLNYKTTRISKIPRVYEESLSINESNNVKAYVKIQDGCNNFCSYCIVPYVRGRSRSRSVFNIISEVSRLQASSKEIILTGIDISDYRIDGELALGKLLVLLKDFPSRLRLGSIEVRLINDKFLEEIKEVNNLCPHFHLSLQSGSDSVLKRMNRKYTSEEYFAAVQKLRKQYNNPAITTDIIVGFPEETEEEFKETLKFVKKVKFSQIHIFPYSMRPNTPASKMAQVNGNIVKNRIKKLEKLENKLRKKYINKCKNKLLNILIEEKENEYYIGHTENYIKCYIKGNYEINTIKKIKIKNIFKDGIFGIIKEK